MLLRLDLQFFAQKKGGGSAKTNCNHDSISKRRGIKLHEGESARAGMIIVRQLGTKYKIGKGTFLSKDYTIHAKINGKVKFNKKKK